MKLIELNLIYFQVEFLWITLLGKLGNFLTKFAVIEKRGPLIWGTMVS